MQISVIASGSTGNCYTVSDGRTKIMLECGIPFKKIQRAIGFAFSSISGCLVTHEHNDHAHSISDLIKLGINCYMSAGTANAKGVSGYRVKTVAALKQFKVGTFLAVPFKAQHDAAEPLSYLLYSTVTKERLVFVTDSYYVANRLPACDYYMIECNYIPELISETTPDYLKSRLWTSHMNLNTTLKFFSEQDLSKCKQIYLIHLSNARSDENRMKREVQKLTGKDVTIA